MSKKFGNLGWSWVFCIWLLVFAIELSTSEQKCFGNPTIRFDLLKDTKVDGGHHRVILQYRNRTISQLEGADIALVCVSSSPVIWDYEAVQVSPVRVQLSRKDMQNSTCPLYSATLILQTSFNGVPDFASGKYSCIVHQLSDNDAVGGGSRTKDSILLYNNASNTALAQPLDAKKQVIYSGGKQLIIPCIVNSPEAKPLLHDEETEESTLLQNKTYKHVQGVGFEVHGVTSSVVNRTFTCVHLDERVDFQVISKPDEAGDNDMKVSAKTSGTCTVFICESNEHGVKETEMAFIPCSNPVECGLMRKYLEWAVDFNVVWERSEKSCLKNPEKTSSSGNPGSLWRRTSCTECKEDSYVPNGVFACRVKKNRQKYKFIEFSHPNITKAFYKFDLLLDDYIRERNPSNYITGAVEAKDQGITPYYVGEGITVVCIASKFRYPEAPLWFIELTNGTLVEPVGEEILENGNYVTKVTKTFILTRPDIKNLVCRVARWDSAEWDNLTYPVPIKVPSKPEILNATASNLKVMEGGGNVTIFCQFSGDPRPEFFLLKDGKKPDRPFVDFELAMVSTTYSAIPSTTASQIKDITGVFECHARNLAGHVHHVMNVTFVHSSVPQKSILIPVMIAVAGATALLVVVFLIVRYSSKFSGLKSKNRATIDVQEVCEKKNTALGKIGPSGVLIPYGDKESMRRVNTDNANCYGYAEIDSTSLDSVDVRSSTDDISLDDVPVFTPEDLSFDEKLTVLGEGNFGVVYKGYLRGQAVAVKSVKHGRKWLKALKSELKIFSTVGYHENVVSLVGVVQQGSSFHTDVMELQILIEYCENGDLRSFLRSNRGRFCDLIENDQIFDPTVMISPSSGESSPYTKLCVVVSTVDLIYWAIQCAAGMEYLASQKIVHGDLALRNLLLTSDRVLKVSDFGLSKKLEGKDYYVFRNPNLTRLPWASTAPELFDEPKPSTRTDVWSYGVAIWEMFSLAQTPYRDRFSDGNTQFVQALRDGYRLGMPKHATTSIYEIMLSCWTLDPRNRPSFRQLQETFHRQVPIGAYTSSGSESDLCGSTASPGSTGPEEDFGEEEFTVECEWNPEYLMGSTLKLNYISTHTDDPRSDCNV